MKVWILLGLVILVAGCTTLQSSAVASNGCPTEINDNLTAVFNESAKRPALAMLTDTAFRIYNQQLNENYSVGPVNTENNIWLECAPDTEEGKNIHYRYCRPGFYIATDVELHLYKRIIDESGTITEYKEWQGTDKIITENRDKVSFSC